MATYIIAGGISASTFGSGAPAPSGTTYFQKQTWTDLTFTGGQLHNSCAYAQVVPIVSVSRTSNVATYTVSTATGWVVGDHPGMVGTGIAGFDTDAVILSTPTTTSFTTSNTGVDVGTTSVGGQASLNLGACAGGGHPELEGSRDATTGYGAATDSWKIPINIYASGFGQFGQWQNSLICEMGVDEPSGITNPAFSAPPFYWGIRFKVDATLMNSLGNTGGATAALANYLQDKLMLDRLFEGGGGFTQYLIGNSSPKDHVDLVSDDGSASTNQIFLVSANTWYGLLVKVTRDNTQGCLTAWYDSGSGWTEVSGFTVASPHCTASIGSNDSTKHMLLSGGVPVAQNVIGSLAADTVGHLWVGRMGAWDHMPNSSEL